MKYRPATIRVPSPTGGRRLFSGIYSLHRDTKSDQWEVNSACQRGWGRIWAFFFFTEFDLCSIKEPKFDTYAATISPPCWFLTIKIPTRLNHRSNERYLQEFSVKCFLFWFLNLFHKTIKKKLVTARKLLQHIYNYNWHPTWATTGQNTHFKSIDMCYKHTHVRWRQLIRVRQPSHRQCPFCVSDICNCDKDDTDKNMLQTDVSSVWSSHTRHQRNVPHEPEAEKIAQKKKTSLMEELWRSCVKKLYRERKE